jgi:hypothetical protein
MNFKSLLTFALSLISFASFAQQGKTDMKIVRLDHFAQTYKKGFPSTDVLGPNAQKEVSEFAHSIAVYAPDLVCQEVLPEHLKEIDSLYGLYILKIPMQ